MPWGAWLCRKDVLRATVLRESRVVVEREPAVHVSIDNIIERVGNNLTGFSRSKGAAFQIEICLGLGFGSGVQSLGNETCNAYSARPGICSTSTSSFY